MHFNKKKKIEKVNKIKLACYDDRGVNSVKSFHYFTVRFPRNIKIYHF